MLHIVISLVAATMSVYFLWKTNSRMKKQFGALHETCTVLEVERKDLFLLGAECFAFMVAAAMFPKAITFEIERLFVYLILGIWFATIVGRAIVVGSLSGMEPAIWLQAFVRVNREKSQAALKNLDDKLAFQQLKEAHNIALTLAPLHVTLAYAKTTNIPLVDLIKQIQVVRHQAVLFSTSVWAANQCQLKKDGNWHIFNTLAVVASRVDRTFAPKDLESGRVFYDLQHASAEDVIQNVNQIPGSFETLFAATLETLAVFEGYSNDSKTQAYERVLASMRIKLYDSCAER